MGRKKCEAGEALSVAVGTCGMACSHHSDQEAESWGGSQTVTSFRATHSDSPLPARPWSQKFHLPSSAIPWVPSV